MRWPPPGGARRWSVCPGKHLPPWHRDSWWGLSSGTSRCRPPESTPTGIHFFFFLIKRAPCVGEASAPVHEQRNATVYLAHSMRSPYPCHPQCNVTTIGEWGWSCSVCKADDPTFCLKWWVHPTMGHLAPLARARGQALKVLSGVASSVAVLCSFLRNQKHA